MDQSDLRRIFRGTILLTLLVVLLTLPNNADWSAAYGWWSLLALANWWGLSQVLHGMTGRKTARTIAGFTVKGVCLFLLLVYVAALGIEVTSFLAGLHTFMAAAILYGAGKIALQATLSRLAFDGERKVSDA